MYKFILFKQKHVLSDNSDGEHDAAHEIARLRAQLVHERTIYTREMARMRAQLRAFESHLAQTVARMGALLEMVKYNKLYKFAIKTYKTRNVCIYIIYII